MPRFRLRTLLLAFVVMSVILLIVKYFVDFNRRLGAEYRTAQVIRDVTKYVEINRGKWPASWDDIPYGDDARWYVVMRFDLKVAELIDDPALIQSAIVPISGKYLIYPHAEQQLNDLRDILVRFHSGPAAISGSR
jgi:hypothetical protein